MDYFSSQTARITWDDAFDGVLMVWKTPAADSAEFRAIVEKELELIEQRHPRKMLLDMRKMGFIPPEDQAWLDEYWDPRAAANGLKYVAMIVPERLMPRQVLPILTEAGNEVGLFIQFFEEEAKARAWLKGL
jgi:hypothetical protein